VYLFGIRIYFVSYFAFSCDSTEGQGRQPSQQLPVQNGGSGGSSGWWRGGDAGGGNGSDSSGGSGSGDGSGTKQQRVWRRQRRDGWVHAG